MFAVGEFALDGFEQINDFVFEQRIVEISRDTDRVSVSQFVAKKNTADVSFDEILKQHKLLFVRLPVHRNQSR